MIDNFSFSGLISFLENCQGFSHLPPEALKDVAGKLILEFHPKGTHLFEENQSKIENIYLLFDGRGEKRWKNDNLPHLETPHLEKGEVFGAFSILLNEGWARRSLFLVSDCFFFLLPRDDFLKLCLEHPNFKTHFTSHLSAGIHLKSLQGRHHPSFLDIKGHETAAAMANDSFVRVSRKESIRKTTELILERQGSFAIIEDESDPLWGIVTYRTLSESVILKDLATETPIEEIAVRKVLSAPSSTELFRALLLMAQHEVHHLPLVDTYGKVISVLCTRDMPQMQGSGVLHLLANINKTRIPRDLQQHRKTIVDLAQDMNHKGFAPHIISEFIARSNDAIVCRVVELTLEDHELPCPFSFVVFGSEGRDEQTLIVDQDNGIIFEPGDLDLEETRSIFMDFGRKVCEHLDYIGYPHCKGGVMASEPGCCKSLEEWSDSFKNWIDTPTPQSVMKAQIYFDIKHLLGQEDLVEKLMSDIHDHTQKEGASFLHHLAIEVIRNPVPLGFFQNIILSNDGEHRDKVDLKGIQNLLVDPIRLMSLKHKLRETNSMKRLQRLHEKGILKAALYDDIRHAYENVLHLRLLCQETSLRNSSDGSNHLKPDSLGDLDRSVLKAVLILAQNLQRKIQRDFDVAVHSI